LLLQNLWNLRNLRMMVQTSDFSGKASSSFSLLPANRNLKVEL